MADAAWRDGVEALRRAAARLSTTSGALSRLGSDAAVLTRLGLLDEVPSCATFEPFAVTSSWPTDLGEAAPVRPPAEPGVGAWIPRLTERARVRERLSLVPGGRSGQGAEPAPPLAGAGGVGAAQPAAAPEGRTPPGATSPVAPSPGRPGIWSVLGRIAESVGALEPVPREASSVSSGSAPGRAVGEASRFDAAGEPAPPRSSFSGSTLPASPGSSTGASSSSGDAAPGRPEAWGAVGNPPAGSDAAGQPPAPGLPAEGDQPAGSPASLLSQVVAELWGGLGAQAAPAAQGVGTESAAQSPAAAPRAPSRLLSAAGTTGGGGTGERGAARADAAPAEGGRAGGSPETAPGGDDEELLERVNRALVEQGWLRGLDLT